MPLSKAKDRERWHQRKLQPNSNLDVRPSVIPKTSEVVQPKLERLPNSPDGRFH